MPVRIVLAPHPEYEGLFPALFNEPLLRVVPKRVSHYRKLLFFCTGEGSEWHNVVAHHIQEWDATIAAPGATLIGDRMWRHAMRHAKACERRFGATLNPLIRRNAGALSASRWLRQAR